MEANLRGAHLTDANFDNASLYKADLRFTQGLTVKQLARAKTLYMAKFDPDLRIQLEKNAPHLLGVEKDEKVSRV